MDASRHDEFRCDASDQVDYQWTEESGADLRGQQSGPGDQHVGGARQVTAGLEGRCGGGHH